MCLTLCDPMDCSPPGSFVLGILQARILEWVAIFSVKYFWWHRTFWQILSSSSFFFPFFQIYTFNVPVQFSSVAQSCPTLCDPMDCRTPGIPVHSNSQSLLRLMSHESVMPTNHLILCRPHLFLPSIFPSISVFSNESVLPIRWTAWSLSFSISPSNEYSGLIYLRMDWLNLLAVQGTPKSLLQHHSSKASILRLSAFFIGQLTSIHDYWKNHTFDQMDLGWQSNISAF